jgi:hypothetical protein
MASKKSAAQSSAASSSEEMASVTSAAAKTKTTKGKTRSAASSKIRGKKTTSKSTGKKTTSRKTTGKTRARKTSGKRTTGAKRSSVASRKSAPAVQADIRPAEHIIEPLEFESTVPMIGDPTPSDDQGMTFASEMPSLTASAASAMPAADTQPLTMLDMTDLFPSSARSEESETELGFDTEETSEPMETTEMDVKQAEAVRQPGAWHLVADLYMVSVLYSLIILSGLYWLLGLGGPDALVNSATVALEGINQLKLAYLGGS